MIELNLSDARNNVGEISHSDLNAGNYFRRGAGAAGIVAGVVGIPSFLYASKAIAHSNNDNPSVYFVALSALTVLGLCSIAKFGYKTIAEDVRITRVLREVEELKREDLEGLLKDPANEL